MLADAGGDVTLWARRPEVAVAINERRVNPDYLPEIRLPENLTATADPERALAGAQVVVLAGPSHTLRANLTGFKRPGSNYDTAGSPSPPTKKPHLAGAA